MSGLGEWAYRLCFGWVVGCRAPAEIGVAGLFTFCGDLESGRGKDAELRFAPGFASVKLRFEGRLDSAGVLLLEPEDCGLVSELARSGLGRSREAPLLESGALAIRVPSFALRGRLEPDVTVWLLTTFCV